MRLEIFNFFGMNLSGFLETRGNNVIARAGAAVQQLFTPLIIDADNALRRIILPKKQRFCLEIFLERMMIIQMILREVRKRGHRKVASPRAQQIKCMGAYFHGHHGTVVLRHAAQKRLQVGRFRCGVRRFLKRAIGDNAYRADNARFHARFAGNMVHQVRSGRFAIRAGNTYQGKLRRREIIEGSSCSGHGLARIAYHNFGHVGRIGQVQFALHHQHFCTMIDSVLRKRVAIGHFTHNAEECISRLHFIAAVGNASNGFVGVADNGAIDLRKKLRACFSHEILPYFGEILYRSIAYDIIALNGAHTFVW